MSECRSPVHERGDPIRIRPAAIAEADSLSRLALRSKAYWGYDDDFLDACSEELTVSAELIEAGVVRVAEIGGRIAGFFALRDGDEPSTGELEFLYVAPFAIGRGCGKALWAAAAAAASGRRYRAVLIRSDPHAEGFYAAMGAERVGDVASGSIAGRRLPLMRYAIVRRAAPAVDAMPGDR